VEVSFLRVVVGGEPIQRRYQEAAMSEQEMPQEDDY